jgi:hypothetical protein
MLKLLLTRPVICVANRPPVPRGQLDELHLSQDHGIKQLGFIAVGASKQAKE